MNTNNMFKKRLETIRTFQRLISIFFLLYFWNELPIYSQSDAPHKKNEIRFAFFQILNKSVTFNYERFYKNHGTSLTIAPSYNDSYYRPYLYNLFVPNKGIFLQIDQKIYLKSQSTDYGIFYLSTGIKYRYRLIKLSDSDYGVRTYYHDRIKTFGVQIVAGIKYTFLETFVIDFYFGGAIYKSIMQLESTSYNNYTKNSYSPGYSGVAPVINCTFGFKF